MSTLVDTSILTRGVYKADPQHQLAVDTQDFQRYQGITILSPRQVSTSP